MKSLFFGIGIGFIMYALIQPLMPVNWSCQMAFTRQTVSNPNWAKDYWDDVANKYYERVKNDTE